MPKIHSEPLVTTYCTFLVFCRNIMYLLTLIFPYIHKLCCLLEQDRDVSPQKLRREGLPQHAGMLPATVRAVRLSAGDELPAVPLLPLLPAPAGGGTGLCTPAREPP